MAQGSAATVPTVLIKYDSNYRVCSLKNIDARVADVPQILPCRLRIIVVYVTESARQKMRCSCETL